ncbi:MAG: hypothetical protein AAFX06_11865 [Planctomycetota bacterium]
MKKLFAIVALVCLPCFGLTGCGNSENKIVDAPEEPAMSDDQMSQYEEQMRSGEGGSGR